MEQSSYFGFNLPSSDSDIIADINAISDNFRTIDNELSGVFKGEGVDQVYNPESKNAQSGIAVAEATSNLISLEDNTEWVFDGGSSSGSVDIDLVIDDEMSGVSNNLVPNKIIKKYVDEKFLSVYPVGSIYMSINNTNPSVLFGGFWERIRDKFLLASGNKFPAGQTGGEEKHVLTVDELPSHTHDIVVASTTTGDVEALNTTRYNNENTNYKGMLESEPTGNGAAHNNMPPYLSVYIWQRVE